jgi:hypothetical protein
VRSLRRLRSWIARANQFLARTGFAQKQHRRVAGSHGLHEIQNMAESRTLSHNSFEIQLAPNFILQIQFFLIEPVFQFGNLAIGWFQSSTVGYDLLESALIRVLITGPKSFVRSCISFNKGPPAAEAFPPVSVPRPSFRALWMSFGARRWHSAPKASTCPSFAAATKACLQMFVVFPGFTPR